MFPVWPETLPKAPRAGSDLDTSSNVIESRVESGSPKRRRRSTKIFDTYNVKLQMSMEQWRTLKTFHRETLREVLPFTWVDVEDPEADAVYKFVGGGPKARFLGRRVDVSFKLEKQP